MGQPREVMNRLTDALVSGDWKALGECYASDAVIVTPDQNEIKGREAILEYFRPFRAAFNDLRWESLYTYESGTHAFDEGYVCGTHTGTLTSPTGEEIAPTRQAIRVRECEIASVEDGVVTSHRFYFDQVEFFSQLGLIP